MKNAVATGTLSSAPIPMQLAAMRRDRWTGLLLAVNGGETRSVYVDAGEPVWAATDDPAHGLGPYLCRRGLVSLRDADREPAAFGTDVLPATGRGLARDHAEHLLLELFSWSRGSYTRHRLPELDALGERLTSSAESILSRGMARVTDLGSLRTGVGPESTCLTATTDVAAELLRDLAEDTGAVLGAIRAGSKPECSAAPWPSDFRLYQCLWELRLLALVSAAPTGEGVEVQQLLAGSPAHPDAARSADDGLAILLDVTFSTLARPTLPSPAHPPSSPIAPALRLPPVARLPAAKPAAVVEAPPPAIATELARVAANAMDPEPIDLDAIAPLARGGAPLDFDDREVRRGILREAIQAGPHAQVMRLDTDEYPPAAGGADKHVTRLGADEHVTRLGADELGAPDDGVRAPMLSAHDWFLSGLRFAKAMDLYTAVRSFQEAVRITPDNAVYRIELAKVMARNPKWRKEAEEHLLAAAELTPFSHEAHLALARLYRKSGMVKRAIGGYRTALQINGECREAANELKDLMAQKSPGSKEQSLSSLMSRISKLTQSDGKSVPKTGAEDLAPADAEDVLV